ncbi:Asp-tRNA(Asn)/Glu-tRNA(Gln) amidotransferase subunit GatB [Candidatus Babeliales bacterium]|nr:Asp-tRNA(Asn)/Glu-tRNA(Gln) amidotransferase subunit GatB [Candidatus Babeliales bacterium]
MKKNILDRYPEYESTIGIEIHVQLKTKSKMFCSCQNKFGDRANINICPICSGHPGTLPVLNKKAVDFAIMAGLATNCKIAKTSTFARKHYMYPDLPKNFQITQDDKPICYEGYVTIKTSDEEEKKIRLIRIHMEEDAGKNIHGDQNESFVDLNRAGTPLLEIVSYPDIKNAYEAKTYLRQLHSIVQYLGISDADMEKGSFRADTNISVKKKKDEELGTRVELKNINSFKYIGQAIDYEVERQITLLEENGTVLQETRLWDTHNHKTLPMRKKEEAQDYRYFEEPDIPMLAIKSEQIEAIKKEIPELPDEKYIRLKNQYGVSNYEANILIDQREIADFFEASSQKCKYPKQVSNWILRDLLGYMKEHKLKLKDLKINPEKLAELVTVIEKGIINSKVASHKVFPSMMETGKYPSIIIQEQDLKQIGSKDDLEKIILDIIEKNPDNVQQYRSGKDKLFMFFVGQAMKETKGKGNPKLIQDLLKKHLK